MPTPIPSGEITAYLNVVRVAPYPGGQLEVDMITQRSLLVNYEDVNTVILRQLYLFDTNPIYLIAAINSFSQNSLYAVGVINGFNQLSPPISDPVLIINSNLGEVIITDPSPPTSPPQERALTILGSSSVNLLTVTAAITLNELYIGTGCSVTVADASLEDSSSPPISARIEKIYLPFAKNNPSCLRAVTYGSQIGEVVLEDGSFYGGIQANNPGLPCNAPVTAISAQELTHNGALISWTSPTAGYLFINISYRKSNSKVWIPVTAMDGDYIGNSGFAFRYLESDTYYDMQICATCTNGGKTCASITTKTTCCGAGTQMQLYRQCPITILISATADSPPGGQTLCNGQVIDLHYPPGTTITIPYLATIGATVLEPFVMDNVPYQLMPYNSGTGTWNAAGTAIGSFIEGNVITVNVSIPAL